MPASPASSQALYKTCKLLVLDPTKHPCDLHPLILAFPNLKCRVRQLSAMDGLRQREMPAQSCHNHSLHRIGHSYLIMERPQSRPTQRQIIQLKPTRGQFSRTTWYPHSCRGQSHCRGLAHMCWELLRSGLPTPQGDPLFAQAVHSGQPASSLMPLHKVSCRS